MEVYLSPMIPKPLFFALIEQILQSGWKPKTDKVAQSSISAQDWKFYGIDPKMVLSQQNEGSDFSIFMSNDRIPMDLKGKKFVITFDNSIEKLRNCTIFHVHDLLSYDSTLHHSNVIDRWLQGQSFNEEVRTHYWVSPRDVSDAIVGCLRIEKLPNLIDICGRRGWTLEETRREFNLLFSRWQQSKTGDFSKESLFVKDLPIMIQPYAGEPPNRPNLEPLHALLLQNRVDGWRPFVPLRTMLMELIASIEKM